MLNIFDDISHDEEVLVDTYVHYGVRRNVPINSGGNKTGDTLVSFLESLQAGWAPSYKPWSESNIQINLTTRSSRKIELWLNQKGGDFDNGSTLRFKPDDVYLEKTLNQVETAQLLTLLHDKIRTGEAAIVFFNFSLAAMFSPANHSEEVNKQVFAAILSDMPKITLDDPPKPPWIRYPEYSRYTMGWRMGSGETYWGLFWDWFVALPPAERIAYIEANPEPEGWEDVYQGMIEHRPPK